MGIMMEITLTVDRPKPHTGEQLHMLTHESWDQSKESFEDFEKRAIDALKALILTAWVNTKKPEEPLDPRRL